MDREEKQRAETAPRLPFADRLLKLQDDRRELRSMNAQAAAHTMADVTRQVDSLRTLLEPPASGARQAGDSAARAARVVPTRVSRTVVNRAADEVDQLRITLGCWYRFYDGFDPMFTWWAQNPYMRLDQSLQRRAQTVRQRLVGIQVANAPNAIAQAAPAGRGGGGGGGGGGRGGGAGAAGGGA